MIVHAYMPRFITLPGQVTAPTSSGRGQLGNRISALQRIEPAYHTMMKETEGFRL